VHPAVELFQEGREIRKLKGTYADPMPLLIDRDGRLHPRYRITRTDTGRLSAADPNVLALPKHSTRGKLIRMGFLADEGHELGEWDLAQIEMCVFAHDSGDARMIAEILSGVDKHAATASNMFGRPADVIYAEAKSHSGPGEHQRFAAKAVNFGILMGITEHGLCDQFHKNGMLDWTEDRCAELLRDWFKAYPQAALYIERKHAEARRNGYVRDMFGRLRWLEGIHSDDDFIRQEAERMAQATPVQSGAQGIIKRVMRNVWPVLKSLRSAFWIEPLLQVHDALVLEYAADQRELVDSVMMTAMTSAVPLAVPVKASHSFGLRLGEL
jgi:DNA polymerase-1